MALSGVRSSWLIVARKRDLARFASSARRRASSETDLAVFQFGNQPVLLRAEGEQHHRRAVQMAGHEGEEGQGNKQQRHHDRIGEIEVAHRHAGIGQKRQGEGGGQRTAQRRGDDRGRRHGEQKDRALQHRKLFRSGSWPGIRARRNRPSRFHLRHGRAKASDAAGPGLMSAGSCAVDAPCHQSQARIAGDRDQRPDQDARPMPANMPVAAMMSTRTGMASAVLSTARPCIDSIFAIVIGIASALREPVARAPYGTGHVAVAMRLGAVDDVFCRPWPRLWAPWNFRECRQLALASDASDE